MPPVKGAQAVRLKRLLRDIEVELDILKVSWAFSFVTEYEVSL